ncbi:hypothetical protein X975_18846, partial [Stegodyphus mimosarum]
MDKTDDEIGNQNQILHVPTPQEGILHSPPPQIQSRTQEIDNEDVQILVPTPTTPVLSDKGENDTISETDTSSNATSEGSTKEDETADTFSKPSEESKLVNPSNEQEIFENFHTPLNGNSVSSAEENIKSGTELDRNDYGDDIDKEETGQQADEDENISKHSQTSFDIINSKIGNEDVTFDPTKLFQTVVESLRSAEEKGRSYYNEESHIGELMASEDDSNRIEILRGFGTKDEYDFSKPIRAATPVPRRSSFHQLLNMDLERN